MLSSKYLLKVKRILEMYRQGQYEKVNTGSCNVCCGRQGKPLSFDFSDDYEKDRRRVELAHEECLEKLLDPREFELFVVNTLRKIEETNSKLQKRNN